MKIFSCVWLRLAAFILLALPGFADFVTTDLTADSQLGVTTVCGVSSAGPLVSCTSSNESVIASSRIMGITNGLYASASAGGFDRTIAMAWANGTWSETIIPDFTGLLIGDYSAWALTTDGMHTTLASLTIQQGDMQCSLGLSWGPSCWNGSYVIEFQTPVQIGVPITITITAAVYASSGDSESDYAWGQLDGLTESAQVTPEPASLGFAALGLLGLMILRSRKT